MEAERQTVTGKQPPPLGQEDTEKRLGYKQGPGAMPSSFWEWQKLETELTSAARAKKCCYEQEGKWKKEVPFPDFRTRRLQGLSPAPHGTSAKGSDSVQSIP